MGNGTVIEHRRLAELFPARPNDPVMSNWRRLMLELDLRLGSLQALSADWQHAVNEIRELALVRLNEVLGPAYDTLAGFATLGPGWLLARSKTPNFLQAGRTVTFILDEGAQRNLFVATQFVVIQNAADRSGFAVARVLNYLPASGALAMQVLAGYGDVGSILVAVNSWLIFAAPSAGVSPDGGTF